MTTPTIIFDNTSSLDESIEYLCAQIHTEENIKKIRNWAIKNNIPNAITMSSNDICNIATPISPFLKELLTFYIDMYGTFLWDCGKKYVKQCDKYCKSTDEKITPYPLTAKTLTTDCIQWGVYNNRLTPNDCLGYFGYGSSVHSKGNNKTYTVKNIIKCKYPCDSNIIIYKDDHDANIYYVVVSVGVPSELEGHMEDVRFYAIELMLDHIFPIIEENNNARFAFFGHSAGSNIILSIATMIVNAKLKNVPKLPDEDDDDIHLFDQIYNERELIKSQNPKIKVFIEKRNIYEHILKKFIFISSGGGKIFKNELERDLTMNFFNNGRLLGTIIHFSSSHKDDNDYIIYDKYLDYGPFGWINPPTFFIHKQYILFNNAQFSNIFKPADASTIKYLHSFETIKSILLELVNNKEKINYILNKIDLKL